MLKFFIRKQAVLEVDYMFYLPKEDLQDFFEHAELSEEEIQNFYANEEEYESEIAEWIAATDRDYANREITHSTEEAILYWIQGTHEPRK